MAKNDGDGDQNHVLTEEELEEQAEQLADLLKSSKVGGVKHDKIVILQTGAKHKRFFEMMTDCASKDALMTLAKYTKWTGDARVIGKRAARCGIAAEQLLRTHTIVCKMPQKVKSDLESIVQLAECGRQHAREKCEKVAAAQSKAAEQAAATRAKPLSCRLKPSLQLGPFDVQVTKPTKFHICAGCGHHSAGELMGRGEFKADLEQRMAKGDRRKLAKDEAKRQGTDNGGKFKRLGNESSYTMPLGCTCSANNCVGNVGGQGCVDCEKRGGPLLGPDPRDPTKKMCVCERCMCTCDMQYHEGDAQIIGLEKKAQEQAKKKGEKGNSFVGRLEAAFSNNQANQATSSAFLAPTTSSSRGMLNASDKQWEASGNHLLKYGLSEVGQPSSSPGFIGNAGMSCALCYASFAGLSLDLIQMHYNQHLEQEHDEMRMGDGQELEKLVQSTAQVIDISDTDMSGAGSWAGPSHRASFSPVGGLPLPPVRTVSPPQSGPDYNACARQLEDLKYKLKEELSKRKRNEGSEGNSKAPSRQKEFSARYKRVKESVEIGKLSLLSAKDPDRAGWAEMMSTLNGSNLNLSLGKKAVLVTKMADKGTNTVLTDDESDLSDDDGSEVGAEA